MSSNGVELKDIIACSPLGFFCLECSCSLKDDNVRTHLQRQHKQVFDSTPPSAYGDFLKELRSSSANASVEDCLVGPVLKGAECSKCKAFFVGKISWIFSRHLKNKSTDCTGAQSVMVTYRNTYCFRQHIISNQESVVPGTPSADNHCLLVPRQSTVTAFQPPTPRQPSLQFSPALSLQNKTLSHNDSNLKRIFEIAFGMPPTAPLFPEQNFPNTEQQQPANNRCSSTIMKEYTRSDEDPGVWAVHFEALMNGGKENFDSKLRQLIALWSEPVVTNTEEDDDNGALASFLNLGTTWFEDFAQNQIKRIPGNIRNKLVVFDAHEHGGSLYGGSFALRDFRQRLTEDLRCLVTFCWRFPTCFLDEVKTCYKKMKVSGYSDESIIGLGVFQKFLLRIFFQSTNSPRAQPPMAIQLCLSRCFKVPSDSTAALEMINCQLAGTRMSNILHLLRAGHLGVIYLWPETEAGKWVEECLQLTEAARSCLFTNLVSPMIADTRSMHSRKATSELRQSTDGDGNITIGQFTFPASSWQKLIPMVQEKALVLFECLLEGDTWRDLSAWDGNSKVFLDTTVSNFTATPLFSWSHGKGTVDSMSLKIKTESNNLEFNRLSALVQLMLHGLGTGAMRMTETDSLLTHQVVFSGPTKCYYISHSNKSFFGQHKGASEGNPSVRHKIPPSLVWVVYLYRWVVSKSEIQDKNSMIVTKGGNSVSFTATSMLAELFQLFKSPTALEMRQLWTSIANVIDPENGLDTIRLTAGDAMSRKSGHTASTHSSYYATSLADSDEKLFELYHAAIGEPTFFQSMGTREDSASKLVADETILKALKILFGSQATFLSESQRELVWYCINGMNRQHIHASTSCGGGKSLAWILPVLIKLMLRWDFGMTMVVVPYNFLERHHCNVAQSILKGKRRDATYGVLVLSDLNETVLPDCLKENKRPRLLFLSVDAMSFLLQHHINFLQKMVRDKTLESICIDEVHTIWGEQSFRPAYDRLRNVASLGCTVVTLTGSLPDHLVPVLASYLGLTSDADHANDMTIIRGGDPVGTGFYFAIESLKEGLLSAVVVAKAVRRIQTYLSKQPKRSVHVIVSTKPLANAIADRLVLYYSGCVATVTSDVPRSEQNEIAKRWMLNELRVLISTTCALVGNECSECRLVLCVGNLYNVCQLVQAIGRLRPSQRGPEAEVRVIAPPAKTDTIDNLDKSSDELIKKLREQQHLTSTTQEQGFRDAFGFKALHNFVHNKERNGVCLVVQLCNMMGHYGKRACGNCSSCLPSLPGNQLSEPSRIIAATLATPVTPIEKLQKESQSQMDLLVQMKSDSSAFFGRLESLCLTCRSEHCDGVNLIGQSGKSTFKYCVGVTFKCLKCGAEMSNHNSNSCPVVLSLDSGRVCYHCLDRYDRTNQLNHKAVAGGCPLKTRLRSFVQRYCRTKKLDYGKFVQSMHQSESSFYKTIALFERMEKNRGKISANNNNASSSRETELVKNWRK